MTEGSKQLDELLNVYDAAKRRAVTETRVDDVVSFDKAVKSATNEVLRPAFDFVASSMKDRGHRVGSVVAGAPITCHGPGTRSATLRGTDSALLSMGFALPDGWRSPKNFRVRFMPEVGFVVDTSNLRLVLFVTDLQDTLERPPIEVRTFDPQTITEDEAVAAIVGAIRQVSEMGFQV